MFPLLFAATIFLASSRSTLGTGPMPEGGDKVVHFAAFGLLATLTCRLGRGWKAAFWALFAASAYGALDEWHQSFVPMRQSDVMDWLADTLGAAVGVITYQGWPRYRQWLEFRLGRRIRRP